MSKTLITFLGTGWRNWKNESAREYFDANYFIDSKIYSTPFMASALMQHHDIERVYIIGTMKSMWEEVYRYFCTNNR